MYLLDTNILSELVKKRPNPQVLSQLRSKAALTLFTSCICLRLSPLQNFLVDQRGGPKGDTLFQNRFESHLGWIFNPYSHIYRFPFSGYHHRKTVVP